MIRRPNLVLIGFMATGKTTVGRACARMLGLPFRDSDTLVELRAGRSIPEIFAQDGEAAFRVMESEAIRTLCSSPPIVISTGGGAVLNGVNVARLRRNGLVVLLWAEPEDLICRVGNPARRPLLEGSSNPVERIRDLLAEREPAYRAAAHITIETTGRPRDETVERVVQVYRDHCSGPRSAR